ncbi:achaete-scute complex protein T3-like [Lineus longissimus]|uniref:achaete-scute complex protein T3-like n=1 Tax=Lineus longissimus TaxID=88925 RepID=UPI00315C784B
MDAKLTKIQKPRKRSRRHVPHSERSAEAVERRNARERRRVEAVNSAFVQLSRHIPGGDANEKIQKIDILRGAISYINDLLDIVGEDNVFHEGSNCGNVSNVGDDKDYNGCDNTDRDYVPTGAGPLETSSGTNSDVFSELENDSRESMEKSSPVLQQAISKLDMDFLDGISDQRLSQIFNFGYK